jgi:hypothetical protein
VASNFYSSVGEPLTNIQEIINVSREGKEYPKIVYTTTSSSIPKDTSEEYMENLRKNYLAPKL